SGAYTLPNVRVGGPYMVKATLLGFEPRTRENVVVALGETQRVDFMLARAATQLTGVQVSARRDESEASRTGAATFVDQVQVSLAPFDVRQGGFTGASINTVTKSGTNDFRGSAYSYLRNDAMIGNRVGGQRVVANPSLSYNQSGVSFSGPIRRDKLFFFIDGEVERTKDPGTNFVASRNGASGFGISRVDAATMDAIRARLATYGYETGPYEAYTNRTDNDKLLAKLDWNVNSASTFTIRYNFLDAKRDLPPHPFVLSFNNTGRGPNASSLPFHNSGYRMNNKLHS